MKIKIGVIGLGYVGLPLAFEFSKHYKVFGYDTNTKRIDELNNGFDKTNEIARKDLSTALNIVFSDKINDLKDCNVYIITVPSPIDKDLTPDLSYIKSASNSVSKLLKANDFVIYESTVYPGCTEEECIPILEKNSGLKLNKDLFCGYSPERINPGDKINTISKIVKVTSGSNEFAAEFVDNLYSKIIKAGTFKAKSIKVAEASKAIENAQRDLNISFMNEISIIFEKIGINTYDVLEAAKTKWNFLNFTPGLVGGHCIGVDPYYLVHKSKRLGYNPEVILSGRNVNQSIPKNIVSKCIKTSIKNKIDFNNINVLIVGFAFKENCPDTRNTKVFDIYENFKEYDIKCDIYDPIVDKEEVKKEYGIQILENINLVYDIVIYCVPHGVFENFNFKDLMKKNSILFDVKNKLKESILSL
ncbi:nucleotide sugar dehydrogenase [Flavobacteriaceae bacterium]|nr:nucleotide sugar dehydrogenase [Flavobacteriaceae bacterium]